MNTIYVRPRIVMYHMETTSVLAASDVSIDVFSDGSVVDKSSDVLSKGQNDFDDIDE
jgi:hypothetical protein